MKTKDDKYVTNQLMNRVMNVHNVKATYSGFVNEKGEPNGQGTISFEQNENIHKQTHSGIWDNGKLTNTTYVYSAGNDIITKIEGLIDENFNISGVIKKTIRNQDVGKPIIDTVYTGNYVNGNFDGPATITEGKATSNVTYHDGIIVGADESYFEHFGENGVAFHDIHHNGFPDITNSENKILIDKINADATTNKIELEACMTDNIDDCISNKEKTMLYIVLQFIHNFIVVCDTKGNKYLIDNGMLANKEDIRDKFISESFLSRLFSEFKEEPWFSKIFPNRDRYINTYDNSGSKYITPGIRTGPCVNISNANAILFLAKFKKNNQNFDKTIKDIKNTKLDDKLMVNLVSLYAGGLPNHNFGTTFPVSNAVNMFNRTHDSALNKYNINGTNQHHYSCENLSKKSSLTLSQKIKQKPPLLKRLQDFFGCLIPFCRRDDISVMPINIAPIIVGDFNDVSGQTDITQYRDIIERPNKIVKNGSNMSL